MTKLWKWWDKHFLNAEFFLVCILSYVILLSSNALTVPPASWAPIQGLRSTLYSTLASIFGSLLGFTITGGAAAFGAIESDRFNFLKESRAFPTFWKVFYAAGRATSLATVAALIALFYDRDQSPKLWPFCFVLFASILATARVIRSAWLLFYVVKIAQRSPSKKRAK